MNLFAAIRKPRIRTVAAVLAVAGSALFASVPTAGATSLRETPHFQCYSYSNGTARLVAERPKINEGENYTGWVVQVFRWNSSNGTWAFAAQSGQQNQNNEPWSFGELTQVNDEFNVPAHSYYEVKYWFQDTTDSSAHYAWATSIMNRAGTYTCWT
jgi:hypothetical protein